MIATKMIDGPIYCLLRPRPAPPHIHGLMVDATGQEVTEQNVSSTLRKSWKIGKFATNANATVASGTRPSSVTNDRLPARAEPADSVKAGGGTEYETDADPLGLRRRDHTLTLYDYRRREGIGTSRD